MQIFLFINGYDQYGIFGVEQLFGKLQPPLHEGEPLTMAVAVCSIYIIVIVFPVLRSSVVGRIDIDAVHLSGIEILQKLQCMVIIRFNQCMPKVAVWRIANGSQGLQIWIDGFSKLSNTNDIFQSKINRLVSLFALGADGPILNSV